jgi:transcriptional regulator with GAF, ATPase, and Fis domain
MIEPLPDFESLLEQRVQERTAELVKANETLREELEQRKQVEKALLEEIAQLKKAEQSARQVPARIEDWNHNAGDYLQNKGLGRPQGIVIRESAAMREVMHLVQQVAPTNSSVLLLGETGTGKELIAELIQQLSSRKHREMVKVNCAALPSTLVESELFGREKGAYTGSLTRQAGRFELANGSTIFLDEVGELSSEVQAKLLRVLQEGYFERLGNPKPFKVDVRVIAATNRDLAEDIRKGRFREDLFYRLNVFPIKLPPLRERIEDIPVLVWAFLEEFCMRMGRKISKIPAKTMEALQRYSWPGNVRELRNIMEHSVIISRGEILRIPPLGDAVRTAVGIMTLGETEREHILRTLEVTHWRIKGPGGAASLLGVKPSTLYSRMEKLRVPTRRQRDEL